MVLGFGVNDVPMFMRNKRAGQRIHFTSRDADDRTTEFCYHAKTNSVAEVIKTPVDEDMERKWTDAELHAALDKYNAPPSVRMMLSAFKSSTTFNVNGANYIYNAEQNSYKPR